MFKFIKKIKELEKRISSLEKILSKPPSPLNNDKVATYEEVIDQWLNGKRS